jgi:hypothetical protein
MAEGARLLSEYPGKLGSRVRIPLSPPLFLQSKNNGEISSKRLLTDPLFLLTAKIMARSHPSPKARGGSATSIEGKKIGDISRYAGGGKAEPPSLLMVKMMVMFRPSLKVKRRICQHSFFNLEDATKAQKRHYPGSGVGDQGSVSDKRRT